MHTGEPGGNAYRRTGFNCENLIIVNCEFLNNCEFILLRLRKLDVGGGLLIE